MRVLLVEDDRALSNALAEALKRKGFTLCCAYTGKEALVSAQFDKVDIVILDLGLPDMDGMEVLGKLRKLTLPPPVLILTARDKLEQKVMGLEQGADDYLVKPFELDELIARLQVFERRLGSVNQQTLQMHGVQLDPVNHTAVYQGQSLDLTRKEFYLLKALMESAGRVVTKDSLEARLYSIDDEVASNAVEVHVHYLRKKIDKSLIKTVRGIGYTIAKSP